MKHLYFILFIFLATSAILVAEETFQKSDALSEVTEQSLDKIEPKDQDLKEIIKPKDSYYYLKLGASPLVPNVGFGYRIRDIKKRRANDFTFNFNAVSFQIAEKKKLFIPTFKYSYLKYKDPTIRSSYFGVGYELGVWLQTHGRIVQGLVPNIELVWGRERDNLHFSQFGINLFPAAVGAYVFVALASSSHRVVDGGGFAILGIAASSVAAMSYTIGF